MLVREIMHAPVTTIDAGASIALARTAMQRAGIRHLVVRDAQGKRAGVVCNHDLDAAPPDGTVGQVMSAPVVTLSPDADAHEVALVLRRHNVSSVAVVERDHLVGIVTASDLLDLLGKGALRIQASTPKWTLPKRGPTHRPEHRRRP